MSRIEFERESEGRRRALVQEMAAFLWMGKKWWLAPVVLVLLLVGALAVFGGSVFAPFLYPLF